MSRELSCFFAREFFWHLTENRLDEPRTKEVQEHLKGCRECSILLERIKVSRKILQDLGQTQVTPEVIEFLKKEHHFWEDFFERMGLTQSMSTFKWAAQLCLVAIALVLTVHAFPWLNLARSLKKMRPETGQISKTAVNPKMVAQDEVSNGGTDSTDGVEAPTSSSTTLIVRTGPSPSSANPASPPSPPGPGVPFIGPRKPTPEELAAVVAKTHLPKPTIGSEEAQKADEVSGGTEGGESSAAVDAKAEHTGFVWRGALKVSELTDELADRVTQRIKELGGKKAGQVELGWHRGNQRYYHFILPEENYEKLLNDLNKEGFVQLAKEHHPRLIKQGYNRIILTIEEEQ